MDLHYLKLFHTLASEQSYTRAANSLFISQPALSMQIKKFEEELGVKLFDKIGNKNILNENGRLLYSYTQKIFSIIEEAEHHLLNKTDHIGGTVNIGGSNTCGTYILPKIIGEFKSIYPDVNVNLHVSDTYEISNLIAESKLDLAMSGGAADYNKNIHVEKLIDDHIVFAASPQNKLVGKEYIEASDLEGCDFIAHESKSQLYLLAARIIEEMKFPAKITMTFGNIDAIKQAVAANLGVSLIPLSAVSFELKIGLIKELKIKGKSWSYPQNLIYNKNRYLSPAARKLIDLIRSKAQKH
ncbi:MAG: LysR family transcriptional regulator [Caulobacteraceae bacterium]